MGVTDGNLNLPPNEGTDLGLFANQILFGQADGSIDQDANLTWTKSTGQLAIVGTGTGTTVSITGSGSEISNEGIFEVTASETDGAPIRSVASHSLTSTVRTGLTLVRQTTGTAANGIGTGIRYFVENDNGDEGAVVYEYGILSDVTDGAEVGLYELHVRNGIFITRKLAIQGDGLLILDEYGTGARTAGAAAYDLQVDADGKVVEVAIGGGGLSVGTEDQIPVTNNVPDDFDYTDNFRFNQGLLISDGNTNPNIYINTQTPIRPAGLGASAEDNICIGEEAGGFITTGDRNICIGLDAGRVLGADTDNVLVGHLSGASSTGSFNTHIGTEAGWDQDGNYNVAIGYKALYDPSVTATYRIAIGAECMETAGNTGSIAIGYRVNETQGGQYSIAMGYTCAVAKQGDYSISMGHQTAWNATGAETIYIGRDAGQSATTSDNAIFLGTNAGFYNQAINNIGIGEQTFENTVGTPRTGTYGIAMGYQAGQTDATGDYVINIGYQAGQTNALDDVINLGRSSQATAANQFCVGTLYTTALLGTMEFDIDQVLGAGTDGYVMAYDNGTGQFSATDPTTISSKEVKSYTYVSPNANGSFYAGGYYQAPAASVALSQASTTQTYGSANSSYAAHAFIVAAAVGTASGGAGAVIITVSGTSITDAGVRTAADSETIVADITTMATDDYYESAKKWVGTITFTLDVGATGHTAYAATFNYGLCKYEDFGNRDFTITDVECVGLAGAADSGFNIEALHHKTTGWTYDAAAFVPGAAALWDMNTDHSTEQDIDAGEHFAWKRASLSQAITGSGSEGFLFRVVTTTNNAVDYMDLHLGVTV